jgi:hypothetical protein
LHCRANRKSRILASSAMTSANRALLRGVTLSSDCFRAAGLAWQKDDFRLPFVRNNASSFTMRIAIVSTVLILWGAAAFAEPAPAPPKPQRAPCMADIGRFCSNVPFGNGHRIACLAKHQKQLAPACQERLPRMQAMFEFGEKQKKATEAYFAKQKNAATRKKNAPPPASPAAPK